MTIPTSDQRLTSNQKVVVYLVGVMAIMGALAWAAVPLYDWFCRVTGYGGTPNVAEQSSDTILNETITIRFDASLAHDMPWEFRPMTRSTNLPIGQDGLIFYEAYNPTDQPVAGTASFNVTPFDVGLYFVKVQCFCFEQQILMPGERVEMPVSFFVDPAIVDDHDIRDTSTITLSYTFHVTDMPEEYAALTIAE